MSTALTVLLAALAWVLASTRPIGSPAAARARTCTEMRAAARHAGWPRIAARIVQIVVVLTLLLLATVCRILWHTTHAIGTVMAITALGIAALGGLELNPGGVA